MIRPYALSPSGIGYVKEASHLCKVEDIDQKEGIVTGYFAAFGNVDSDKDYIVPGAFAKTVAEWGPKGRGRIAHLADHNPTHRIARIQELAEDNHGLRFVSKMSRTTRGRDALIEYDEGILREHSFGFDVIKAKEDASREATALIELRMYEGSAVTWGANPETPVLDVKAMMEDPLYVEYLIFQLEGFKRLLKREITDERAQQIEEHVGQFESAFTRLKTALYADGGPLDRTQKAVEPPGASPDLLPLYEAMNAFQQTLQV